MGARSFYDVIRCRDLSDFDYSDCFEVPVARYVDPEFGAVLWLSRERPCEQSLDLADRDEAGEYHDEPASFSTDWSPPPNAARTGGAWLSGFTVTSKLPSGEIVAFVTGILHPSTDIVTVGSSTVRVARLTSGVVRLFSAAPRLDRCTMTSARWQEAAGPNYAISCFLTLSFAVHVQNGRSAS